LSVVAIIAEPPDVRVGQTSLLTAFIVDPSHPDGTVTAAWSYCNNRGESQSARACEGRTEVAIASEDPIVLAAGVFAASAEHGLSPAELSRVPSLILEAGFWEYVQLVARSDDEEADALKRLVIVGGDVEPNSNPVIEDVRVTLGARALTEPFSVRSGRELTLTPVYDASSFSPYRVLDTDGAWQARVEEPSFTWHVTGGKLDRWVTEKANQSVRWTLPERDDVTAGVAHVLVVLRDGRGGTDVWVGTVSLTD
jgi:hypothetical protein